MAEFAAEAVTAKLVVAQCFGYLRILYSISTNAEQAGHIHRSSDFSRAGGCKRREGKNSLQCSASCHAADG
jgi:hypothetical protein